MKTLPVPTPTLSAPLRAIAAALALGFASVATAQAPPPYTEAELLAAATEFTRMPRETIDLVTGGFTPAAGLTFGSGTPFNDLAYTIFDTDYMDGETDGFDTFMPVDPSAAYPGDGSVKLIRGTSNPDLDATYAGPAGDRIILADPARERPYFTAGPGGVDDDYAVIQNYDYAAGYIQLAGEPADYGLVYATAADGVATEGNYLFYLGEEGFGPDLIAFIWPCDTVGLPVSGNPPRNLGALCNASKRIRLDDGANFRFAEPLPAAPALPEGLAQFGTAGNEIVGGVAVDAALNTYVLGASDGSVGGDAAGAENTAFVAQVLASGARGWTAEFPVSNGTLLFDAVADDDYLYVAGRTLGALPGFANAGRWDAILLKLDLATGEIVASDQYGTPNLDGYGNVTLGDDGYLYVSGAGHEGSEQGTDPDHLVAKHSAETLANVWRVIEAPASGGGPVFVSEAWGGITYAAAADGRAARLLIGGWYMSTGGSAGFLSLYEDLDAVAPSRVATASIDADGVEADWVLDNAIGPDGSLYAAGYTTGTLEPGATARGRGDAYVVRYDPDLTNPTFRQVGSPESDMFRKLDVTEGGEVFASGYTYGDLASVNADDVLGTGDVYVQRFAADLTPGASVQFGTAGEDNGFTAVAGREVFVAGMTEGALVGPSAGSFDAFVVVLDGSTLTPTSAEPPLSSTDPVLPPVAPRVYPNPATDRLRVEVQAPASGLTLYDALGRQVLTQTLTGTETSVEVDLAAVASGMYRLVVRDGEAGMHEVPLIVRHR